MKLPVITDRAEFNRRLEKRRSAFTEGLPEVDTIIRDVRAGGDNAIREFTEKFDGLVIDSPVVSSELPRESSLTLVPALRAAITEAADNIRRFHQLQLPEGFSHIQPDGTEVSWNWRALERVGIYVPGGRYPLLSTVLMNVIPAQTAGVREIAVCTPPAPSGRPDDVILGVCGLLGITEVYCIGGAQAVAALAYGTETIRPVERITGPGNRYVTAAKQSVSAQVGIDMLAGPTEVVILADESANAKWVAADLISQAEHDPMAWPALVTDSSTVAEAVIGAVAKLLAKLPTADVVSRALQNQGFIYVGENLEECAGAVNEIAPEHLCVQLAEQEKWMPRLKASAIFAGGLATVAWGDYWSGANHTLPTAGQARYRGPLSVYDYLVPYSVVKVSEQTLRASADKVKLLAEGEGLAGHALSVAIRKEHDV